MFPYISIDVVKCVSYLILAQKLYLVEILCLLICDFGRAWAANGCRKCFDFSCQMQISEIISLSSKFIEFACKLLCRLCLKCISSAPSCQNRNNFFFWILGPAQRRSRHVWFCAKSRSAADIGESPVFPPRSRPIAVQLRCSWDSISYPQICEGFR